MSRAGWDKTPAMEAPPGYVSNFVEPPSIAHQLLTANVIGSVVFVTFIGLRLYTRMFVLRTVSYDDYMAVLASIVWFALFAIYVLGIRYGVGKHQWDVTLSNYSPGFLVLWVFSGAVYIVCMLCLKVSILLMYRRLFPIHTFRWSWWFVFLFTCGYSIGGIFATIFTCTPINASWDANFDPAKKKCINTAAFYIANGALNSASDLMILVLPLPIVWKLSLRLMDKIILCGLFGLGGISCIMSIVRLKFLIGFLNKTDGDNTYNLTSVAVWTVIELLVSCTCACLPTLKPLLERLRGRGSRSRSTVSQPYARSRDFDEAGSKNVKLANMNVKSVPETDTESTIGMITPHDPEHITVRTDYRVSRL